MAAEIRVALGQFGAELGDVDANLSRARSLVEQAAARGAELLCLPELCLSGYLLERQLYEPLLDDVAEAEEALAAEADERGIALVYGAPRRREGELVNAVVLHRPGARPLVYAKTHMDAKERRVFRRGDEFVVERSPALGLACCYDLAFPEAARMLALAGARALLVPMAWEVERGFVVDAVAPARAVENVAWVVCVNQAGRKGPFRFRGGSCVVDPLGRAVLRLGEEDELEVAELDLSLVDRLRNGGEDATYPLLDDRRADLYERLSDSAQ